MTKVEQRTASTGTQKKILWPEVDSEVCIRIHILL